MTSPRTTIPIPWYPGCRADRFEMYRDSELVGWTEDGISGLQHPVYWYRTVDGTRRWETAPAAPWQRTPPLFPGDRWYYAYREFVAQCARHDPRQRYP